MLKKICLICAAVVMTWMALLVLLALGYNVDRTLLAALMGMSIGAIATKYVEGLFWKTYLVVLGLPMVWFMANGNFKYGLMFLAIILLRFIFTVKLNPKKGAPQPDRFKDCC